MMDRSSERDGIFLPGESGARDWLRELGGPILYPAGMQGVEDLIPGISRESGFACEEYDGAQLVKESKFSLFEKNPHTLFQSLLQKKPVLFIVPTAFRLKGEIPLLSRGRVGCYATISTGTDHADLAELGASGIGYLHAPGANARSVVEYDLGVLVQLYGSDALRSGELSAGIIGYGKVGSRLGEVFQHLGIDYRYYDPYLDPDPRRVESLESLLSSDVLFFHASLSKGGNHPSFEMIDLDLVRKIPKSTVIVSAARGELFSKEAAMELARNHRVVYDVFPEEPPPAEMIQAASFVTPHIAGYNYEARAGGLRRMFINFYKIMGWDPDSVPRWKDPAYDHYVGDFLELESKALKRDPGSFIGRRSLYPPRGDLMAYLKSGNCQDRVFREIILSLGELLESQ